jgi:hypothetical protein
VNCDEARVSIHFHLDGDDHLHVKKARAHVAACTHCEQHVSELLEIEYSLKGLQKYAAPAGLKERIVQSVQCMPQKQALGRRTQSDIIQ